MAFAENHRVHGAFAQPPRMESQRSHRGAADDESHRMCQHVRAEHASMKLEALWLRLHCLFSFSTVRFVLPQQFFNRIGVAFLFGPEIADVD
jgi:hypothetical protein